MPVLRKADIVTRTTFGALMAMLTAADRLEAAQSEWSDNVLNYQRNAALADIRVTECITDAKGDRSLSPSKQPDPDAYVHIVDRDSSGVVIRGAKLHITGASLGHDLMVMPTKSMKAGEDDYAIAGAVPVNSPGVKIINSAYAPSDEDSRPFVEKYMQARAGVSGESRMRLMHAIRDVTADGLGGWHHVTNVQSGGGLYAQRIVSAKHYDIGRAREQALHAAGIADWEG